MNQKHKENIFIQWTEGKTYQFSGILRKSKPYKAVYCGEFVHAAPAGLQCGVPYCVKRIHILHADKPQGRDYYDLVDFRGDHLREILAWNPAAEQCRREIKESGKCNNHGECWIVEPLYKSSREFFTNSGDYPVSVRLDLLMQYALGCMELGKNQLGGIRVLAHRDLKADNGMLDDRFGKIRIRLIDFASIRLDKVHLHTRQQVETAANLDNTYDPGAMSSSNTAPEYLSEEFGPVQDKTDVYALGMLLGNLFLRDEDGRYVNPSFRWVRQNGWSEDGRYVDENKLLTGFQRCMHVDVQESRWHSTWIEQDLHGKLRWENIADKSIRDGLRKLFFHATRIQVKDRMGLKQFITELDKLIQLDAKSVAKAPVSMYLIDLTDFDRFRDSYSKMARYVFAQEKQVYGASTQALWVAYRNALPSDKSTEDAVKVMNTGNLATSAADLSSILASCNTRNGTGSNMLTQAAFYGFKALRQLTNNPQSRYAFTGRLHLFMPRIPEFSQMLPIGLPSGPIGLMELCSNMNNLFEETTIRINAYTEFAPDPFSEDGEWYNYNPLRGKGSVDPERRKHEQTAPPPPETVPENPKPRKPRTRNNEYFLIGDNGEFFYLGGE